MSMDGGICQVCRLYHFEADEGLCPDCEEKIIIAESEITLEFLQEQIYRMKATLALGMMEGDYTIAEVLYHKKRIGVFVLAAKAKVECKA